MLATVLAECESGIVYPNGYRHSQWLDGVKKNLSIAPKFVLDVHATAMAASVALSKPSSIMAALGFLNLASSPMWIEFQNLDLRAALANLGSPNIKPEHSVVAIERSGFMIQREGDTLLLDYVHTSKTPDNVALTDMAPVRGYYSLENLEEIKNMSIVRLIAYWRMRYSQDIVGSGRIRELSKLISNDEAEFMAEFDLKNRFRWRPHPDAAKLRSTLLPMLGEEKVLQVEELQAEEMRRMFLMQILPAMILLNCRNAVDVERVAAPEKLNKQRLKKGREPISEYNIVKVHLSATRKKVYESHGGVNRNVRGGLVMGHFKVRKSGIFWWSPHWRGSASDATSPKTYVLTR
jgi:hypothetical protein